MSSIKRFLLIIALTAMWSPSFLFIKLAVNEVPPMTVVSLRITLAAIVMLAILFWKKRSFPTDPGFWVSTTMMALLSSVFPFCLFCYAEQTIDSALAALLNGTSIVFTAVFSHFFIASDRMNLQKGVGVLLSCAGVILLFSPQLAEGVSGTSMGMLAGLLAAINYAMSHVFGKKYTTGQQPYVAPAAQLLVASVVLWPFTLYYEQTWTLAMPSYTAIFSILSLSMVGTVVAFITYYKLLEISGPTALSSVACFFPVLGMLLGFIFLDETFSMTAMISSGVILLGMVFVSELVSLDFLKAKPVEQVYEQDV